MKIRASAIPAYRPRPAVRASSSPDQVSLSFGKATKAAGWTAGGAAIGYALGQVVGQGGFTGAVIGSVSGVVLGAATLGPLGNGKGGEGLAYPMAGAVVGGVAGLVLGALGGAPGRVLFTAVPVGLGLAGAAHSLRAR